MLLISHNMNDVFEVADRIAVLHLGRMVAVRPVAELDRQIVVDLMTTGASTRTGEPRRAGVAMAKVEEPVPPPERRRGADRSGRAATWRCRPNSSRIPSASTSARRWRGSRVARPASCPVVAGLLLVSILFQSLNCHFLTVGNLVNLLVQAAVFSLLAMGEVFALLLGEIDLSIGFVRGIGGVVMAELVKPAVGWPWWAAIAVALIACALIGASRGR